MNREEMKILKNKVSIIQNKKRYQRLCHIMLIFSLLIFTSLLDIFYICNYNYTWIFRQGDNIQ